MKICGISDIHGNLLDNVPECDVLCIAGDVITLNAQRNFDASEYWWKNRFVPWVMKLPCKKVLVVPGNHDIYLENLYLNDRWKEFCDYMAVVTQGKLHFLIDQSFEYEEIKFYGTPWIEPIDFQKNRWAFETINIDNYTKIPECDVLVTHDNPSYNRKLKIGGKNKSSYWFYGHWHEAESYKEEGWFNCSRLNDCYSFKKNFKFPTINIKPMEKTKYEILQEFGEEIKKLAEPYFNALEAFADANAFTEFSSKIDELFVKFLDNPKDKEDEIPWNESSFIDDTYETVDEYDDK